jgi:hypothetical protein
VKWLDMGLSLEWLRVARRGEWELDHYLNY